MCLRKRKNPAVKAGVAAGFYVAFLGAWVMAEAVPGARAEETKGNTAAELSSSANSVHRYTVAELLQRVMHAHPTVLGRESDRESAASNVTSAKLQFLPTPGISTTRYSGQSATISSLNQPLWTGGKLTAGLSGAQWRLKAANADLADARLQVQLRLVSLLQTYRAQQGRCQILVKGVARLQALVDMITRRVEAGASAKTDLDLVRSRLAQTRSELRNTEGARETTLATLSQILGFVITPAELDIDRDLPPLSDFESIKARTLDSSPALRRAEANRGVAQSDRKQAEADLWPNVSLRLEHQTGEYLGTLAPGNRAYLALNYTPGAGLSAIPAMHAASSRITTAEKDREAAERELISTFDQEKNNYLSAQEQLQDLHTTTTLSQDVLESSERLFVLGKRSWFDLVNSVRDQIMSGEQESDAKAQVFGSYFRLRLLAGDEITPGGVE